MITGLVYVPSPLSGDHTSERYCAAAVTAAAESQATMAVLTISVMQVVMIYNVFLGGACDALRQTPAWLAAARCQYMSSRYWAFWATPRGTNSMKSIWNLRSRLPSSSIILSLSQWSPCLKPRVVRILRYCIDLYLST